MQPEGQLLEDMVQKDGNGYNFPKPHWGSVVRLLHAMENHLKARRSVGNGGKFSTAESERIATEDQNRQRAAMIRECRHRDQMR